MPGSRRLRGSGRLNRRRLPSGDNPDALAGLGVVGDEREVPAELDDGRQLAAFVIGPADRFSGDLVHGEHAASGWDGGCRREGARTVSANLTPNLSKCCELTRK